MTSDLNGAPVGPLSGWVIAITGGKDLIGQPVYARAPLSVAGRTAPAPVGRIERLSPVYELQVKIELMQVMDARTRRPALDPNGQPMLQQRTNYGGVPVLLLASITELELPEGATIIQVDSLSREDRQRMAACVAMGEQMAINMRSADSNIQIASALPVGLKPPGQLP